MQIHPTPKAESAKPRALQRFDTRGFADSAFGVKRICGSKATSRLTHDQNENPSQHEVEQRDRDQPGGNIDLVNTSRFTTPVDCEVDSQVNDDAAPSEERNPEPNQP
ncbi:MAG: hypothetical protein AAF743_05235 [Planctomycetota bacterium]